MTTDPRARVSLEPDPIPVLADDEGIATDAINFVRTQHKVVPFVALDSTNNVVFGPFPTCEHAVESIKYADFTADEWGPIIGDKGLASITKTDLENAGWRFLPLMDLDPAEPPKRAGKFGDQPGQQKFMRDA